MRIAITAGPGGPVPPTHYGGIERIIYSLINGLLEKSHDVTLFAHRDSQVTCKLLSYPYDDRSTMVGLPEVRNMWHVSRTIMMGRFDIVHSFGRLAYLAPILPLPIRKLMSYQLPITPRSIVLTEAAAHGSLHFASCSAQLMRAYQGRKNWHVVYNGVSQHNYAFSPTVLPDAPLISLGRIERQKGTHFAIEVARRSGRRLVIAGPVSNLAEQRRYFDEEVAPHIDGMSIRHVGSIDDREKNELLGSAAALLMPVQWEEPFGIVMAEALACGTPVIGLARGSVPEIVRDSVNGFVCQSVQEMVEAVGRISLLDRRACRQVMEDNFSDEAMVAGYVRVYEAMTGR
jgi:glycosyltransferase involved in cell wall biosynthesis